MNQTCPPKATLLRRSLFSSTIALLLAFLVLPAMPTPAQAAPATGYYSVPYSDSIYYHNDSSGTAYTRKIDYATWVAAGSPSPIPAATDFVKYRWSPTIYAVSYFDGGWLWSGPLAFEQWQKAGYPAPRNAGFIDGTRYHKWATSGEIFAWAPDNTTHKLSYSDWAASGFQEPEYRTNEGYQKLAWNGTIAKMFLVNTGDGFPISYSEWEREAFPTPQTVSRFPGDEFCQYPWSPDIFYYGPIWLGQISYQQWAAAGYPRPTPC